MTQNEPKEEGFLRVDEFDQIAESLDNMDSAQNKKSLIDDQSIPVVISLEGVSLDYPKHK